MSKLFFIIGLRRSGTSILRTLMLRHPDIGGVEFEPHDLWNAIELKHFPRLMESVYTREWVGNIVGKFNNSITSKWKGAKFALNPGVKALEWVWLERAFLDAKFIFIIRNPRSTWNSYFDQDKNSVRGTIGGQAYFILSDELRANFQKYVINNQDKSCIVNYEKMLDDPDKELWRVWEILKIKPLTGLKPLMKKPRF